MPSWGETSQPGADSYDCVGRLSTIRVQLYSLNVSHMACKINPGLAGRGCRAVAAAGDRPQGSGGERSCVGAVVSGAVRRRGQLDLCWTYNVGEGALKSSTMLKKINAARHDEVPGQVKRWNRAGGKVLKGLARRREAEAALDEMRWYEPTLGAVSIANTLDRPS
jgi:hypothetical protein